jgi:transposase-like protein
MVGEKEEKREPIMTEQHSFKRRHFEAEVILLCVRWYLRYALSYRDLEEILLERGLHVDHTTIYRWLQHSAPELEKRCRPLCWLLDISVLKIKTFVKKSERQKALKL